MKRWSNGSLKTFVFRTILVGMHDHTFTRVQNSIKSWVHWTYSFYSISVVRWVFFSFFLEVDDVECINVTMTLTHALLHSHYSWRLACDLVLFHVRNLFKYVFIYMMFGGTFVECLNGRGWKMMCEDMNEATQENTKKYSSENFEFQMTNQFWIHIYHIRTVQQCPLVPSTYSFANKRKWNQRCERSKRMKWKISTGHIFFSLLSRLSNQTRTHHRHILETWIRYKHIEYNTKTAKHVELTHCLNVTQYNRIKWTSCTVYTEQRQRERSIVYFVEHACGE